MSVFGDLLENPLETYRGRCTGPMHRLIFYSQYYSRNTRHSTRRRTAIERSTRRRKSTRQAPETTCTTSSDLPVALPSGSSVEMYLIISPQSPQTHRSVLVRQSAFQFSPKEEKKEQEKWTDHVRQLDSRLFHLVPYPYRYLHIVSQ